MIYNKGIYNKGKYVSKCKNKDGILKHTKEYLVWRSMFARCYSNNYHGYKNYKYVEVCDEWIYFQTFAEWFYENYYTIENDTIVLDKDYKTFAYNLNKNYTPKNCIFIPQIFNKIITFQHEVTLNLPVGVKRATNNKTPYTIETLKKYNDKRLLFSNVEDAYEAYLNRVYEHLKCNMQIYDKKISDEILQVFDDFIKNDSLRQMHKMQKLKA